MMTRTLLLAAAALSLAACSPEPANETSGPAADPPPVTTPATEPSAPAPTPAAGEQGGTDLWKTVANAGDQDRVARLADAWKDALADANKGHLHGAEIDALGLLGVPDAGLTGNLQPGPGR